MPFFEIGAEKILKKLIKKKIQATNKLQKIENCKTIIICIGTPIDKFNRPQTKKFLNFFYTYKKIFKKEDHLIIRSSIFLALLKK